MTDKQVARKLVILMKRLDRMSNRLEKVESVFDEVVNGVEVTHKSLSKMRMTLIELVEVLGECMTREKP